MSPGSSRQHDVVFTAERGRLFGLAYRLLGEAGRAEDVVQDAWIRWHATEHQAVRNPAGYLTRIVTNRCLDELRSAAVRREQYVGPWLPEPVVERGDASDAADDVVLAESVRMAFLVVLERLSPAERAAFVLREVFGYDYDELASVLDRSEASCRQLVARARTHVATNHPRYDADAEAAAAVTERFVAACAGGDVDALLELLAPDVVLTSDGGGAVHAARKPVYGADRVARFVAGIVRRAEPGWRAELATVNDGPGLLLYASAGVLDTVASVEVADDRIAAIYLVRNPDKLAPARASLRTPKP